jgi:flagellar hook-length control protein FliK
MRITGNPESAAASSAPQPGGQEKPRKRFSEVLEKDRQRATEDSLTQDDEKRAAADPSRAAAIASPVPFSPLRDAAPVDAAYGIAAPELEPLLTSLVDEITVEAPPDGRTSIDIQFDSRTLEGLHVRIQKAGHAVEVRFSTSSEAISRLLTANSGRLTEALIQRGYVAPNVSVQRPQGSMAFFAGEPGRSNRDGNSSGRHNQGRGQKRR